MGSSRFDWETSLGGAGRDFPKTRWSRLLGSFEPGRLRERPAFEELARHYWKPIYAYVRAKWAKSNDDAKDMTQDFFLWTIESDFLSKADPERGRFRAFVKVALKHYLANEEEKRRRQKRGGGRPVVPLDEMAVEPGLPDARSRTPEEVLDEAWRNGLIARAAELLERALRAEGKEVAFQVFRDYHLEGSDAGYRETAAKYGISEIDVSNHLMRTKQRLQAIMTDLVAETVQGEEELREELRSLFGTDAGS